MPIHIRRHQGKNTTLTLKLTLQQQWFIELFYKQSSAFFIRPSSTGTTVWPPAVFKKWWVLFHTWSVMCNTNLYDWYVYVVRVCCVFCGSEERCIKDLKCPSSRSLLLLFLFLWMHIYWTWTWTWTWTCKCSGMGSGLQEMQLMQHLSFGCWNPVWKHPKSPTLYSEGLYTYGRKHYNKLHMQCKTEVSDENIRSLKIFSGQTVITLLAMYSSL